MLRCVVVVCQTPLGLFSLPKPCNTVTINKIIYLSLSLSRKCLIHKDKIFRFVPKVCYRPFVTCRNTRNGLTHAHAHSPAYDSCTPYGNSLLFLDAKKPALGGLGWKVVRLRVSLRIGSQLVCRCNVFRRWNKYSSTRAATVPGISPW